MADVDEAVALGHVGTDAAPQVAGHLRIDHRAVGAAGAGRLQRLHQDAELVA
jgi:hypothetical protein